MNRENIQKVRDVISALPDEKFDMRDLFIRGDDSAIDAWVARPKTTINECGTAACIAGWTLAIFRANRPRDEREEMDTWEAGHILGLDKFERPQLFMPLGFSEPGRYTRQHAVRVLDHLLETGEVDWSIIDAPTPQPGAA